MRTISAIAVLAWTTGLLGCSAASGHVSAGSAPPASNEKLSVTCTTGWSDFESFVISNPDPNSFPVSYLPAVQVTVTNGNSNMVYAAGENVDLYDASGDLIKQQEIRFSVTGIAAGSTITGFAIVGANAASCTPVSYDP